MSEWSPGQFVHEGSCLAVNEYASGLGVGHGVLHGQEHILRLSRCQRRAKSFCRETEAQLPREIEAPTLLRETPL